MKKTKILFTARHALLDSSIAYLSQKYTVSFFQSHQYSAPRLGSAKSHTVIYGTFGVGRFTQWFNLEITTPSYVKRADHHFSAVKPDCIVTLDFFRLSFVQSVQYVRRNPGVSLYVYAETQRWPKKFISRIFMKAFFRYLKRNQKQVTKILVYTQYSYDFFSTHLPGTNVEVVPAPVDTSVFMSRQDKKFLPNGTLRIMFNARYAAYKRHQDVFAAVANLRTTGMDIQVTCIGRADAGRVRIEKMAKNFGIESSVTFCDPVSPKELVRLYHEHDVLVLPSDTEAVGMVVPEAMACGIPTITSDTVGANVYVRNGTTGYIFPTGNTQALIVALKTVSDPNHCSQLGTAAREHILSNHTLDKTFERLSGALNLQYQK